jgi:hypothetical protein
VNGGRQRLLRTESMNPGYMNPGKGMLPTNLQNADRSMDTTDPRKTSCLDVPTPGVDYYLDVGKDPNGDN